MPGSDTPGSVTGDSGNNLRQELHVLQSEDCNTNLKLCTVLLNEFNYLRWSNAVTLALGGRQKLAFINGATTAPDMFDQAYDSWLSKDQLVRAWILNSMEPQISDVFQYAGSALELWESLREMYGNQNNAARIYQLKCEISDIQQGENSFIQHLGVLKSKWNELNVYRPHTMDTTTLLKRADEDKVFQLLGSLGEEYEDLKCHLLMNAELPSLSTVCITIQREEVRRKAMRVEVKGSNSDARACAVKHKSKWKKNVLFCSFCEGTNHKKETCWILHPELKEKYEKNHRSFSKNEAKSLPTQASPTPKACVASSSTSTPPDQSIDFTSNPVALLNEFASYLQSKKPITGQSEDSSTALLGKFAGFLAESEHINSEEKSGILKAFGTALKVCLNDDIWIIDSGASDHMCNNKSLLHDFQTISNPSHVSIANGHTVPVLGTGNVNLLSDIIKSCALYIPGFPFQLLSVSKLTKTLKCLAIFSEDGVIFQDRVTQKKIGEGFCLDGLYYLSKSSIFANSQALSVQASSADQLLWHQRLAHPSSKVLASLFPSFDCKHHLCEVCVSSKFTRLPFPISQSRTSNCFELVHSDIWGPAPVQSINGYKYFALFIDDFSRVTWLYLMKLKSDLMSVFTDFHSIVENQFSSKIHVLRSDNGSEYMSNAMQNYLSAHGIMHETSCVATPQQNGVAERKNRDLLEKTRSMMFQMNIPKFYWSHTVLSAAYIINRLPTRILNGKSPWETLKNKKINLSHLRVFGCTCFVRIQSTRRDKFDPRAEKCIFLGYSSSQKGYKCYNPKTKKMIVSRDVKFDEDTPFFQVPLSKSDLQEFSAKKAILPVPFEFDQFNSQPAEISLGNESRNHDGRSDSLGVSPEIIEQSDSDPNENLEPQQQLPTQPRRNPSRLRKIPSRFKDYELFASRHPMAHYVNYDKFSSDHQAFLSAITEIHDPVKFEDAAREEKWQAAMDEELKALAENHTWSIVQLPAGKKAVGSKWIYKTKFLSDGSVERCKARLVAQGFSQTYGVDYKETFAPVAKMNTVRVLLSTAVNNSWHLFQMDVKNAFLHGNLEEEVYMKLPPGHPQANSPGLVCKLHKALYGLKQSPRAWYSKLSSVLLATGFKCSYSDTSLFIRKSSSSTLVVLIYVDDLIVTGSNVEEIEAFKSSLRNKFAMKDLGRLKYFLGIEVATSSKGLFLNQHKYCLDLLEEVGMSDCKPSKTPLSEKLKLTGQGEVWEDITSYQRLVGKLIYLTITRPDISFPVNLISQFMHSPTSEHVTIITRILRYLKGTVGQGIVMKNNDHCDIMGYTDADWAGNALDRKSTTGFCTFVGGNAVTWRSKKQAVVARSSAEAEYRAMASLSCELIWLKAIMSDLGCKMSKPMLMFCDNQSAMHIAKNAVFHERTKHIEIDCHFIRDQVQAQVIQTVYTSSEDQIADLFTKALPSARFQKLLSKLGSVNLLDPA